MFGDDQKRVYLAIALSLGVLIGWQLLFPPEHPTVDPLTSGADAGASANAGAAETDGGKAKVTELKPESPAAPEAPPAETPKVKEIPPQDVVLETPAYRAIFTNSGARLKAFFILEPEQYQPRGDLVAPPTEEGEEVDARYLGYLPFGSTTSGKTMVLPEDAMYEVVEQSPSSVHFRHTAPSGKFTLDKTFTYDETLPNSFKVEVAIKNLGTAPLEDQLSMTLYGYQKHGEGGWSPLNPIPNKLESICYTLDEMERSDAEDAKESPVFSGTTTFGGSNDRYFMSALVDTAEPFVSCGTSLHDDNFVRTSLDSAAFTVTAGETKSWSMSSYVGPKDVDQMDLFPVPLSKSVDYGIFAFLCHPIRWLLVFFHSLVGNWGVAIIILTVFLRTLMFPINQKGYKNMEGMRRIQGPMTELREKYKNDPTKQQEKMMALYKEHGVSPFGCLPQLLQIPVFFALYRTIYSSVELYHADFFAYYTDLSAPDPYYVLPVLVGIAMFGQQLLMPMSATNPQMKYAMYAMPIVFSAFTFVLPSGLAVYIFCSVSLGIAQQYVIRRGSKTPEEAAVAADAEAETKMSKKRKKKKGGAKA